MIVATSYSGWVVDAEAVCWGKVAVIAGLLSRGKQRARDLEPAVG
jgi:hypothetical protein